MKYVNFKDADKVKFFDELSLRFYNQNFGHLSKSDIELMMFRFYLNKMIEENLENDGTIDYSKCSDYKISKDLGITQQRVRNLKIKSQLTHPIDFDWRKALAKLTENARYDKSTHKVLLNIPDPNLYLEIENFIENSGAYIEKQLNSKILQLRVEYFIDLIISFESEKNRKTIKKTLKKMFKESGRDDDDFDEKEIGKSILQASINVTEIASNLLGVISPGNVVGNALLKLINKQ